MLVMGIRVFAYVYKGGREGVLCDEILLLVGLSVVGCENTGVPWWIKGQ